MHIGGRQLDVRYAEDARRRALTWATGWRWPASFDTGTRPREYFATNCPERHLSWSGILGRPPSGGCASAAPTLTLRRGGPGRSRRGPIRPTGRDRRYRLGIDFGGTVPRHRRHGGHLLLSLW